VQLEHHTQVYILRVNFTQQQLTNLIPGRNSASHRYQGPPAAYNTVSKSHNLSELVGLEQAHEIFSVRQYLVSIDI
jgi:hypothetical protein